MNINSMFKPFSDTSPTKSVKGISEGFFKYDKITDGEMTDAIGGIEPETPIEVVGVLIKK